MFLPHLKAPILPSPFQAFPTTFFYLPLHLYPLAVNKNISITDEMKLKFPVFIYNNVGDGGFVPFLFFIVHFIQ